MFVLSSALIYSVVLIVRFFFSYLFRGLPAAFVSSFISSFKRSREHTATRRCSSSSSLKQRQKLFEHQSVVLRLFLMTMMRVVVVVSRYKTLFFLALVSFLLCFPIGFVQSLSSDAEASGDHYRFGLGKRRDPFVFAPTRGQGRGIQMYYGSFGGASNCETCLVKARWLAEVLEVETLRKGVPDDEPAGILRTRELAIV